MVQAAVLDRTVGPHHCSERRSQGVSRQRWGGIRKGRPGCKLPRCTSNTLREAESYIPTGKLFPVLAH